jgi:hypothetical protein
MICLGTTDLDVPWKHRRPRNDTRSRTAIFSVVALSIHVTVMHVGRTTSRSPVSDAEISLHRAQQSAPIVTPDAGGTALWGN